jgi:hypothetical protein
MNQADRTWLENRILAAVDDDFYLDRDEEKRIKEEGASKGIGIKDIELVVRTELDKLGAVCERLLIDDLERLLHQFTDNDRKLDGKEERDALDKVVRPAAGKKKGLDPRVAEEYVNSFCKVNGVIRSSERNKRMLPVALISGAVLVLAAVVFFVVKKEPEKVVETKIVEKTVVETKVVQPPSVHLSDEDKAEIDDQLRRAAQFVESAQYTDPPEKSAKACLDRIRMIDTAGQYRGAEVKALSKRIVDYYIDLATRSYGQRDVSGTTKWLDRAKLMNANMELIRDKEREFGIIKVER